jgi:hypothetical protein
MDSSGGTIEPTGILRGRYGPLLFRIFKYTLYALLAFNVYLFLRHETLTEALDSFGWIILLATFEFESSTLKEAYSSNWEKYGLLAAQVVGYGIALHVTVHYALHGEWLDLANGVVWLLVCAAIGYDMYAPGVYGGWEWRIRNAIKIALYSALVGIAIWWGIQGDVLDFYDAVLWILCFAVVELNIFHFEDEIPLAPP